MQSKLSGCCSFTKFLFIFFNVIFFLIGAAALGIGIWAQVSKTFTEQVYKLLEEVFKLDKADVTKVIDAETIDSAAILIIVGGAVVMVLGFIGCFGALKENQCLLGAFFVLLFLILGVIVAGVILVQFFPSTLKDNFKPVLKEIVGEWNGNGNANQTIDLIQTQLKCCGVDGKIDYNNANKTIPHSCYPDGNSNNAPYDQGCLKAFSEQISAELADHPWIVAGIGIGVLGILIIGMVLSCCLCCAIRKADGEAY